MTTQAALLAESIARSWSQMEACFPDVEAWRAFSARVLALLRRLEDVTDSAGSAEIERRIEELFAEVPAALALIRAAAPAKPPLPPSRRRLDTGLGSPFGKRPGAERAGPAAPAKQRHTLISVLYGTDRLPLQNDGQPRYADDGGDELSFGIATVSLPDDHKKGALERPRWYRLEFRENADKHVVITSLGALSREQFVAQAQAARQRDGSSNEALVFVHGYNVAFDDSIRRTAQFAVDLEFRGIAVAYSWPSKGSLSGYGADANTSESSMFKLAEFIALVRGELGLQRVHVVAHSMGSRLLARALNQALLAPPAKPQAELHQVVFAAPDIDPKSFGGFAKVFTQSCKRCTLYASSHDLALTAARWIYRSPRAGDAGAALLTHGVDTIDASKVDQSLLGHSYFSDRRSVLADLHELLDKGLEPGLRFGLREIAVDGGRYWAFKASKA